MGFRQRMFDQTGGFGATKDFEDRYIEPGIYACWFGVKLGSATSVALLWQVKSIVDAAGYGVLTTPWQTTSPLVSNILNAITADGTFAFTLTAPSQLSAGAGPINPGPFPGGDGRFRVAIGGSPNSTTRVALVMERVTTPDEV